MHTARTPSSPELSRRGFLAALSALALTACRREDVVQEAEVVARDSPGLMRPPLPASEPLVRVRLDRVRGREVRAGAEGQPLLVGPEGGAGEAAQGPVTVTRSGAGWVIREGRGRRQQVDGAEPLEVRTPADAAPGIPYVAGRYPGVLRLVPRTDVDASAVDVVNVVAMEQYLPGVVAGELFSHWKPETRAAQAVAARSYAATEHVLAGRRHFDLHSTAASQVYKGLVDHQWTIDAVQRTRGLVLSWQQRLVSGYYSACCGGTAASAADVIARNPVNDIPPLRGRDGQDACTHAKIARWTVKRPADELLRRLHAWGRRSKREDVEQLGPLDAIRCIERNPHGRPTRFELVDRDGRRAELTAERLRRACDYTGSLGRPARPLWSAHVDVEVRKGVVRFDGRGHGHGAGLCQYGAEALARKGHGHREILAWYYPGVELVVAYG